MLGLSQAAYIDQILVKFAMQDSKKELLHFRYKSRLSKDQSPRNHEKIDCMRLYLYASVMGSVMYTILCTRPGICFTVGMVSGY